MTEFSTKSSPPHGCEDADPSFFEVRVRLSRLLSAVCVGGAQVLPTYFFEEHLKNRLSLLSMPSVVGCLVCVTATFPSCA